MKDMEQLEKLHKQLKESGRLREILNDDDKIQPSIRASKQVEEENPDTEPAEKYRLAQAQTLLDLAEKYQSELN